MRGPAREEVVDHVPIDGKTLRGSRSGGYEAVHLLAACCEKVIEGGGDSFFAVKENQPGLLRDIELVFEKPFSPLRTAQASA